MKADRWLSVSLHDINHINGIEELNSMAERSLSLKNRDLLLARY